MPPPPWRASGIRPLTNGISERLNSVSPSDRCYVVQTARSPVVLTKTQWSPSAIYFRVVDRAEMFFKMFDFSNVRTGIHRCRRPIYTWRRSKSVTIWNVHNSADIFSPLTTVCHSAFFPAIDAKQSSAMYRNFYDSNPKSLRSAFLVLPSTVDYFFTFLFIAAVVRLTNSFRFIQETMSVNPFVVFFHAKVANDRNVKFIFVFLSALTEISIISGIQSDYSATQCVFRAPAVCGELASCRHTGSMCINTLGGPMSACNFCIFGNVRW